MAHSPAGGNKKQNDPISSVVSFTNTSYRADANALDINELIVKNPNSTFFMRVESDALHEQGIFDGDVLVIDRSLEPKHTDTVVVEVDGELEVVTSNKLRGGDNVIIWGVVVYSIHKRRH